MQEHLQTKDLIIGAYTNYNWTKIKYWANSIKNCGFAGDKVMIVYNSDQETVKKLIDLEFKIWAFGQNKITGEYCYPGNLIIVVERFYNFWYYLNQLPEDYYRYVISTDVKDVIFQKNPSEWLEKNLKDKELVASSESLQYCNEPWGDDNLKGSFPMLYNNLRNKTIWNCGVQAGKMKTIKELWFNIWSMCKTGERPNPDQAAYNVLLNTNAWSNITKFTSSEDGWAAQCGTTVDPTKIENFRPFLLDPEPKWIDSQSTTNNEIPHTILHQWDRVPQWAIEIEKKYG